MARPAAAQTEVIEYYGHDALGSIRIVFSASGVATARADYEPFGEAVTIAGMPTGPLPAQQFTGQERDGLEIFTHAGEPWLGSPVVSSLKTDTRQLEVRQLR